MRTKEEILKHVEEVMKEYVDPNVAQHGGKVNVLDFDMDTGSNNLSSKARIHSFIISKKYILETIIPYPNRTILYGSSL